MEAKFKMAKLKNLKKFRQDAAGRDKMTPAATFFKQFEPILTSQCSVFYYEGAP